MAKRVLSVGQCAPDHAAISDFLRVHFQAEVAPARLLDDAVQKLRGEAFDLVLVNRKLDADYSDGLDVVRAIKSDPELAHVPVMLVTNYPEHQQAAAAAGAVPGFGKLEFHKPETIEKLRPYLS
jgi:CheY-like chemotaxis protein